MEENLVYLNSKILINKIISRVSNTFKKIKKERISFEKTFKDRFAEARKKPVLKRNSALIGFSMVLAVLGITLAAPILAAVAKDMPNPAKPPDLAPYLSPSKPALAKYVISELIISMGRTLCSIAMHTGLIPLGISCNSYRKLIYGKEI